MCYPPFQWSRLCLGNPHSTGVGSVWNFLEPQKNTPEWTLSGQVDPQRHHSRHSGVGFVWVLWSHRMELDRFSQLPPWPNTHTHLTKSKTTFRARVTNSHPQTPEARRGEAILKPRTAKQEQDPTTSSKLERSGPFTCNTIDKMKHREKKQAHMPTTLQT